MARMRKHGVCKNAATIRQWLRLSLVAVLFLWRASTVEAFRVAALIPRVRPATPGHDIARHPRPVHAFRRESIVLRDTLLVDTELPLVPVVLVTALVLGVAAQSWINSLLSGDQGLGAYLKDGNGYSGSGFRPRQSTDATDDGDPLPWLKLPKLDFVEVAGQGPSEAQVIERLEALRSEMQTERERGNEVEAASIQKELESLMAASGFEFKTEK